jgi:radical SAM protein with 4Fe4S-binding SPASM domain
LAPLCLLDAMSEPFMSIFKIANYLLVNSQRIIGRKHVLGYPYYVVIDPCNVCQLECPFCDGRERAPAMMKFHEFKRIIDAMGRSCINLELYNWGEPFLNKDTIDMINYAGQKYHTYIRISSNLNLSDDPFFEELVQSRLNSLTISLDGASPETYETYRVKGSFDKVIRNIKLIVQYKKQYAKMEPKLVWQFLVFRHNEHEIEKARQLARELSVDDIVFAKPHIPQEFMNWDSTQPEFSNRRTTEGGSSRKLAGRKKDCNWPYTSVAINANGSVSPCCAVAREEDDFGDIFNHGLSATWNNDKFKRARRYAAQTSKEECSDGLICARCDLKGSINFAPNIFQVFYYTFPSLRRLVMKANNYKLHKP